MSTFDSLMADLARDARRVQPKDALQFCANWFQTRLQEQRTLTRDALSSCMIPVRDTRTHPYHDNSISPVESVFAASPFTQSYSNPRPSLQNSESMPTESPFGTLNVPGNALLSDKGTTGQHSKIPPTFSFDGDELSPPSPLSPANRFASFANGPASPDPGESLHPPTATALARRTSVNVESIAADSGTDEHKPLPEEH